MVYRHFFFVLATQMTQRLAQDRNFDTLIDRFEKRIYQSLKGDLRLQLIKEDLAGLHQSQPMAIWDAGCGFGQMGQWFAENQHQLTLCDLSKKMLMRAQQNFADAGLTAQFHHQAAQTLAPQLPQFDLVLFHAVLEWLANPLETLATLCEKVLPGGHLSLLFYNRNAMVWTNVLKGGWRWQHVLDEGYMGKGSKLTPPNPHYPEQVLSVLAEQGFKPVTQTGIRVFHDYLTPDVLAESDSNELLELEYRYCRQPTYRDMARYIHVLAQKQ